MTERLTTVHHRVHSAELSRTTSPDRTGVTEEAAFTSAASNSPHVTTPVTPKMGHTTAESTATPNQSVFNLINAVLGVGVLGFPYAFKTCGILLATCLVFFIVGVTLFSVRLLLLSSQLTGKKSYEDMAQQLFGKSGEMVINICILLINLGAMVSYLNVLADVLSSVSGTIIPPGLEPSRNSVLIGITVLAVLPVSIFVQDAASLACVSISSVSIIFVFTFMMMLSAMRPMNDINVVQYWDPKGAFVSFPVIAYGFTIHTVVFPVYTLLRSPSVPKMSRIVNHATWLCALVYLMVGTGGYLTFGKWTHGDILRNLGAADPVNGQSVRWIYERLLKLSYGASIVGTIPLVMLPSLSLLTPMLDPFLRLSRIATKRLIAVVFVGVSFACAVLIPNVEFVLGLNGGTSSVIVSYIMPGLIYLRASSTAADSAILKTSSAQRSLKWKARCLVVLGVILGVLCTSATLKAVHQENEVVNLVQNIVDKNKEMEDAVAVGQKTLQVVKTVDVVETASKELDSAQGETEETLDALHTTAKSLNDTLDSANSTAPTGIFGFATTQKKQETVAYKTVLQTIRRVLERVQATLETVMALQDKLRELSEEIGRSEDGEDGASSTQVDGIVKDLTAALGMSLETEDADHTFVAVQKEIDTAIAALSETIIILEEVEKAAEQAVKDGKQDNKLRELVVSAMDRAIHATRHSALALNLTSHALDDAAADQKSELVSLLRVVVEDYETESAAQILEPKRNATDGGVKNKQKREDDATGGASLEKLSKFVAENATQTETELNVKEVELTVKAALNETTGKKREAISEAHAAVERANPTVAAKAGEITREINAAAVTDGVETTQE